MTYLIIDNTTMDKPKGIFQDYIAPGDEAGSAYGNGGFQDWVPAPEPVVHVIEETTEEQKKQAFLERMAKGREAKKAALGETK